MSAVLTATRTHSYARRQQIRKTRLSLVAANQPEIIPTGADLAAIARAREDAATERQTYALWVIAFAILLHATVIGYVFYGSKENVKPPEALPMTVQLVSDTPPPPQVKTPPPPPQVKLPPPQAVSVKEPDKQQEEPPRVEEPPPPAPVTPPMGRAGYKSNPAPTYPEIAQTRGWEGTVLLKVHVLASGRPDDVEIDKSSGHKQLDDAAVNAVKGWIFVPAKQGDTAIDGWVTVPIDFRLTN